MKILFLTNYPSPYKVEFFNSLGAHIDLDVVFEQEISEQIHRNSHWFIEKYYNFKPIFLKKNWFGNKFICLEIINVLNKNNYDLIIVGNYATLTGILAIQILKKKKVKFAIQADGGQEKSGRGLKELLKKNLISSATWWLSSSEVSDKYFLKYGAKGKGIYRYPFSSFKREEVLEKVLTHQDKIKIRNKLNMSEEKIILTVGRFDRKKGFDTLIKTAKIIEKNVGVYIVGGKPTPEYLKIISDLNINNVKFIDFKSKDLLKEYYKAADLFVLPTRNDVWGLVINEAMTNGLPIITTNKCVAGLELIEDYENGFIYPVDNIKELAEKINMILMDTNLRTKMSNNNLKKIKNYSLEDMVEVFNSNLKEIVEKKNEEFL